MICTRGTSCGGYRDPADPVLLDLDGTVTQGAGHDVCAVVTVVRCHRRAPP
jgi:hypothetical protein